MWVTTLAAAWAADIPPFAQVVAGDAFVCARARDGTV